MWRRIGALVRKEFIQMRRDRRTLAMMLLLPVIWLIAFGYAVNFDVSTIHLMVVDQAKNEDSQDVIKQVEAEKDFVIKEIEKEENAKEELKQGTADVVLVFPENFQLLVKSEKEQLKVWVDGSRLFTAQSSVRKLNEVLREIQQNNIKTIQEKVTQSAETDEKPTMSAFTIPQLESLPLPPEQKQTIAQGIQEQLKKTIQQMMEQQKEKIEESLPNPEAMSPEVEVLFNPDLKSVNYMIPGLMGLVLIFITTLMTALGVVREKEKGTLEQLIVSPLRSFELILGKLLPYMMIATIDFIVVFVVGVGVFDVPFNGDLFSYFAAALFFLFGSLGVGLLVSTVSQNQQQAMQLAVLTLLPQFILSGFIFPLEAMPWAIRWLSYLMPLTYFLPISRDAFLKGLSAWDHPLAFGVLVLFAVLFLLVATVRFKRSLT